MTRRWLVAGSAAVLVAAAAGLGWWLVVGPAAGALPALPGDLERRDPAVAELIGTAHEALRSRPHDAQRWLELAMALDANEFVEAAEACYQRAVELDPSRARSWYLLARARAAEPAAAEAALRRALELEPAYAPGHARLGRLYLEQGRHGEAESAFRAAIERDRSDSAGWLGLAQTFMARRQHDEAAELLEARLEGGTGNPGYARHLLAMAYRQSGRSHEAEALAREPGATAPSWRDPWEAQLQAYRRGVQFEVARARALLEADRPEEAIEILEAVCQRRPGNLTALTTLGSAYRGAGQLARSAAVLRGALALDEGFFHAHFHLAVTLAQMCLARPGDEAARIRAQAVTSVERALALNPTYAPAHGLRGDLHNMEGAGVEAIARYREAMRCDPGDRRWPLRLGVTLLQFESWEEAEPALARAAALDAANPEAHRALAKARLELGHFDAAEAALAEARKLSPDDPRIEATAAELETRRRQAGPPGAGS